MLNKDLINGATILLMTIGITALFLSMIQPFLLAIFLAALFSAMARPLYLRLYRWTGGHRHLASALTLLAIIVTLLIPLIALIGIVFAQAISVSQSVTPWVKSLNEPGVFASTLAHLPFYEDLLPFRDLFVAKAGEVVAIVSKFLIGGLSSMTLGTANFLFMSFVMLYSMYFLQMDGDKVVKRVLYYLPLKSSDEHLMLDKFTSVTRATLKGTMLIGVLQGTLAGLAFALAGIDNAVFWGTVMAVLSVIPSVGSALVWIPAVILLAIQGSTVTAILLGLFCGLIVGSLDNLLRPILVGKDTKMHELMIFYGTLGGIFMFGLSGIVIGPLIASLFITIWDMYGTAFRGVLPVVDWLPSLPPAPPLAHPTQLESDAPVSEPRCAATAPSPDARQADAPARAEPSQATDV